MALGPKTFQASSARRYDLWPGRWDPDMGGHPWSRVELRIARSRKWMLREARVLGAMDVATDPCCMGAVTSRVRRKVRGIPGRVRGQRGRIASLLLNEDDLLLKPSELIAHECTHAAMRFLEFHDVIPTAGMAHEEVLAYTVGELVKQTNRIFYAHAFRQGAR